MPQLMRKLIDCARITTFIDTKITTTQNIQFYNDNLL